MPLTICAIGNSHLASCKLGWGQIRRRYPDVEIVFFGAQAVDLTDLAVAGSRLLPTTEPLREKLVFTSRGKAEIGGDYDRYLLWGLDLRMAAAVKASVADRGADVGDRDVVLALRTQLLASVSLGLCQKLRVITNAPIGVVPVPMPSEERTRETLGPVARDGVRLAGLFRTALGQLGQELGFHPLFQPDGTLADLVNTKAAYSLARPNQRGERDVVHMNGDYGALMLEACLQAPDFIGGG